MGKMKKTIYIILSVILLGGLSACNVVDIDPNNKYDSSYGFKDQTNVELYLNSFYPMTANFGQFGSNALGGSNSSMSDGLTDILKYGAMVAGAGDCNLIMTVDGQQSVNTNYFDAWTTCYGWIRRINEFLDGLEQNKGRFSQEQVARFKAEALYYRGYAYFLIMRSHGIMPSQVTEGNDLGAILHLDINTQNDKNKTQARSTVAQTWDQIAADLEFAKANLPQPANARGRLNCHAANALYARAMLYAERYDKAKAGVQAIIDSGKYGYIDDYSAIFKDLTNKEVIWGYGYYAGILTHSFDQKYSQPGDICTNDGKGSGYAGPTQEFVDSYDYADGTPFDISDAANRYITNENASARDPRLAASVMWNGSMWKGRALECYEGAVDQKYMPYGTVNTPGNTVTGYYIRKMMDESNHDFLVNGSYQPWIEFRYAEMMLIYAECLAHEGKYADSRNVVADLRKARFGREDVATPAVSDLETAMNLILKERATELCFEGHRFWDLRRTGRAAEVLGGKKYNGVLWKKNADGSFTPTAVSCDMGARKYPSKFDAFPIPQNEISNNSKAIQNPGW